MSAALTKGAFARGRLENGREICLTVIRPDTVAHQANPARIASIQDRQIQSARETCTQEHAARGRIQEDERMGL